MSTSRLVVVHCDLCGRSPQFDGWEATAVESRESARDEGYHTGGGRDICPECWEGGGR